MIKARLTPTCRKLSIHSLRSEAPSLQGRSKSVSLVLNSKICRRSVTRSILRRLGRMLKIRKMRRATLRRTMSRRIKHLVIRKVAVAAVLTRAKTKA